MANQRIRVWFRKGERVRYISHLDVLRNWERAIRRAELPLAYSQGFTPHPKLAFASPLPMGFSSEAELMDVTLDERVALAEFEVRLSAQVTDDFAILRIQEVPAATAGPQASMLWADYEAIVAVDYAVAEPAVRAFLAEESRLWTEERGERTRAYDLRKACAWLRASPVEGGTKFEMRLQADQDLTARPEAIIGSIVPGSTTGLITRVNIVLDERSQARELWRRSGQYQ